jgi:hypothetical protein
VATMVLLYQVEANFPHLVFPNYINNVSNELNIYAIMLGIIPLHVRDLH